ncbi:MAG TPA: ABC-type transport auxiliary lipoprotein family protein [Anaeromyxobacteraceae bacterium]|nr:ABC-type transport auxiliary lipoprotein family protein [Anaeromyxobacteraceae bacterium]
MPAAHRSLHRLALAAAPAVLAACVSVGAQKPEAVELYALDVDFGPPAAAGTGPALAVPAPRAAPGFDSARLVYLRRPLELRHYARADWAEPPARMIGLLLVRALERTGRFQAVVAAPGGVAAGLRLETEVVRLQQEFTESPSRVRFTLRAQLADLGAGKVLGTRELEAVEPAPSEDAYGGVQAANRAVRRVLMEAASWSAGLAGSAP